MSEDPIHVTYSTLDDLKSQLLNLGVALDNAVTSHVTPSSTSVTTGAGQFSGDLGDGPSKFAEAWKIWFTAVSDDCSIVGNSVGQAKVDFSTVDAAGAVDRTIEL